MTLPQMNLVVIRSKDLDRAKEFYEQIGLTFQRHAHGGGPEHLACEMSSFVFEIYPLADGHPSTESTRIGFAVPNVDGLMGRLAASGATIQRQPKDSPWGRRAVVRDFDNHLVELTQTREGATN
jgi:predicted enzyme related to lactoylglutathione lyase